MFAVLDAFLGRVVVEIINPIILLLAGAAFVLFLWGVFEFIMNAADETKRTQGRSAILWGIVGLAIIFGAYGIINIATSPFPDIKKVTPSSILNPSTP